MKIWHQLCSLVFALVRSLKTGTSWVKHGESSLSLLPQPFSPDMDYHWDIGLSKISFLSPVLHLRHLRLRSGELASTSLSLSWGTSSSRSPPLLKESAWNAKAVRWLHSVWDSAHSVPSLFLSFFFFFLQKKSIIFFPQDCKFGFGIENLEKNDCSELLMLYGDTC